MSAISSFATDTSSLAEVSCREGTYLTRCFEISQKQCVDDFSFSYNGCVRIGKQGEAALNCALRDLTTKWKKLQKKKLKNCKIKNWKGKK